MRTKDCMGNILSSCAWRTLRWGGCAALGFGVGRAPRAWCRCVVRRAQDFYPPMILLSLRIPFPFLDQHLRPSLITVLDESLAISALKLQIVSQPLREALRARNC